MYFLAISVASEACEIAEIIGEDSELNGCIEKVCENLEFSEMLPQASKCHTAWFVDMRGDSHSPRVVN